MFRRIVLATDGSESALRAARAASALAWEFGAEFTVLYVSTYPDNVVPVPGASASDSEFEPDPDPLEQTALENAGYAVRRTKAVLEAETPKLEFRVLEVLGDPADTILTVADQEKADLIVMGSRGAGGIRTLLLGSVSEKVSREAHCSVLIVREGETEDPCDNG